MKRYRPIFTKTRHRSAFTLIEMMVALAIFMVLMTVIFVPINLGVNMTHIGTARADVQQASQQMLNRIASDLRQAVYVFPNEAMPGITDRAPYGSSTNIRHPYIQTNSSVCASPNDRVSNTSRIDILLPRRNGNVVETPVRAADYLVTYYARRLDRTKEWNGVDNPVVMFRAQIPYRTNDGNPYTVGTDIPNAIVDNTRYPDTSACSNAGKFNRGSHWLAQTDKGEPDLALELAPDSRGPATADSPGTNATGTPAASHQLITPRNMGLIAPRAAELVAANIHYQPETTFLCEDTNSDGKIDRVTITLVVGQFDEGAVENRPQPVRLTQVVDLPNIR